MQKLREKTTFAVNIQKCLVQEGLDPVCCAGASVLDTVNGSGIQSGPRMSM